MHNTGLLLSRNQWEMIKDCADVSRVFNTNYSHLIQFLNDWPIFQVILHLRRLQLGLDCAAVEPQMLPSAACLDLPDLLACGSCRQMVSLFPDREVKLSTNSSILISSSGMHHKVKICDIKDKIGLLNSQYKQVVNSFFPVDMNLTSVSTSIRLKKEPNGGWSDPRDMQLCKSFFSPLNSTFSLQEIVF